MIKELKVTEIQVPSLVTDLNGKKDTEDTIEQQSPTFLAPGAGFMEDDFPMDWGCGGGGGGDGVGMV